MTVPTVECLDWLGTQPATSLEFWDHYKEQQEDAAHWRVDGSPESRDRLLHHLEVRTNMKRAFLHGCELAGDAIRGTVLDVGAGIAWTSAYLSQIPQVQHVFAADIGLARLMRAPAVFDVLGGNKGKLRLVRAGFGVIKLPDKSVNCIVMNGSFHHCYDADAYPLLREMHRVLTDDGLIVLSNEHYVDGFWYLKGVLRKAIKDHTLALKPSVIRNPLETSGEHWRTRREVEAILSVDSLFRFQIHELSFDACNDKPTVLRRLGWHYYSAILQKS